MERWRVRLPELPAPDAGARLPRVGHQAHRARATRNGPGSWPTSGTTSRTRCGCAATRTCGSAACARSRSSARGPRPPTAPTSRPSSPRPSPRAAGRWSPAAPSASTPRRTGARSAPTASPSPCSPAAWTCPYPSAHAELFDAIAAQGVLVSEWPPGRHVSRLRFLVRNRVIAALATGTLVVEAGQRSGAVNTARHARDLRRRLMAVPGPVTSDLSAGCHHIIREWQGALVTSAAEVIEHLSPVGETSFAEAGPAAGRRPRRAGSRAAARRPRSSRATSSTLESATVLDAMPSRGGLGTLRVAQRAGLAPAATATCLGQARDRRLRRALRRRLAAPPRLTAGRDARPSHRSGTLTWLRLSRHPEAHAPCRRCPAARAAARPAGRGCPRGASSARCRRRRAASTRGPPGSP